MAGRLAGGPLTDGDRPAGRERPFAAIVFESIGLSRERVYARRCVRHHGN